MPLWAAASASGPFLVLASAAAVRRRRSSARCASPRRSRWCTATAWSMTICRRWTTAICAAAGRPAQAVRRGDRDPGRRRPADAWPSRCWPIRTPMPTRWCAPSWCWPWRRPAGAAGMVGGQMIDLEARERPARHRRRSPGCSALKTGAIIAFSCEAGAILGQAPRRTRAGRCAAMPTISASPSRSPTICSMSRAARPRPASRSGRTRRPARRPSSSILGVDGRARQAQATGRSGGRPS